MLLCFDDSFHCSARGQLVCFTVLVCTPISVGPLHSFQGYDLVVSNPSLILQTRSGCPPDSCDAHPRLPDGARTRKLCWKLTFPKPVPTATVSAYQYLVPHCNTSVHQPSNDCHDLLASCAAVKADHFCPVARLHALCTKQTCGFQINRQ